MYMTKWLYEIFYMLCVTGTPFVKLLQQRNIMPGIKVDKGVVPLAGTDDECTTQGTVPTLRSIAFQFHWAGI